MRAHLIPTGLFASTLVAWAATGAFSPTLRCMVIWCTIAAACVAAEIVARCEPGRAWMERWLPARDSSFTHSRRAFAGALGIVFLAAFWSWGSQVRGLNGAEGIVPVSAQIAGAKFWQAPSLCWLWPGDSSLIVQCWAGAFFSSALAAGLCPGACALACWALYLSLMAVGGPFSNFQWDALLLETAPLAALWLPWAPRPRWSAESRAQQIGRWLLMWLAFRLTLESGVVKLTWDDAAWLEHRALDFHFQTQPLPLWTSWYVHHWPPAIRGAACWVMYWIEIALPALLLLPSRWRTARHLAALTLVALQIAIAATGNYTFFNCLTIALCLPFFDDAFLRSKTPPQPRAASWTLAPAGLLAIASVWLSFDGLLDAFGGAARQRRQWEEMRAELERTQKGPEYAWWRGLRSFNGYGLFRTMTTTRPELIFEGSNDGRSWREYTFPDKPVKIYRRPALVAPHQPRLDWQLWFAALSAERGQLDGWLAPLLLGLLENTRPIVALLDSNPFPDKPPRLVRVSLYQYRFTRPDESPAPWWHRELVRVLVTTDAATLRRYLKRADRAAVSSFDRGGIWGSFCELCTR